jgi:hypothetical protein
MSRRLALALVLVSLLTTLAAPVEGRVSGSIGPTFHALAWEQQGRVKLAVANTSYSYEDLTVEFGFYRLGRRVIDEYLIEVPPKTILVTTYSKSVDRGVSGTRTADTAYISDIDGRQVATTQIIGIHPATNHYRVDRYLVPAGQEAIAYLETPDPELGIDARIYLSIGRTFTLGDHTGNLIISKIYRGELSREKKPPIGEDEDLQNFNHYSYGWRGLAIKAITPKLNGVERLDFDIEKFISTPEGTARHGLSAPPVLVYGPDMTLMEE